MKLTNATAYQTNDLRRFFLAGLRAMGSSSTGKRVEVVYSKPTAHRRELAANASGTLGAGGVITGRAQLGWFEERGAFGASALLVEGTWVRMRLPPLGIPLDLAVLARVWMHEVQHLRGIEHRGMTPAQRYCQGPLPAWAAGLDVRVVEATEEAPVPRAERMEAIVAGREARARAALKRWEHRLDRAARMVKKLGTKVRGYERRALKKAQNEA